MRNDEIEVQVQSGSAPVEFDALQTPVVAYTKRHAVGGGFSDGWVLWYTSGGGVDDYFIGYGPDDAEAAIRRARDYLARVTAGGLNEAIAALGAFEGHWCFARLRAPGGIVMETSGCVEPLEVTVDDYGDQVAVVTLERARLLVHEGGAWYSDDGDTLHVNALGGYELEIGRMLGLDADGRVIDTDGDR